MVRTVDPFPVNGSRLICEVFPVVYVSGYRFCRVDLEIRLMWEPKSYWLPNEGESVSMDSTRGMDLLDPSLKMVKDGALPLCLQAKWFKENRCGCSS